MINCLFCSLFINVYCIRISYQLTGEDGCMIGINVWDKKLMVDCRIIALMT